MKKILNLLSKIGFIKIFVIAFIAAIFLSKSAFADIGDDSYQQWLKSVYGKGTYDIRAYTKVSTDNVMTSLAVSIVGCGDKLCEKKGSALKAAGDVVLAMYENPPASGQAYFASVMDNLGIVKPAYAQEGIGFKVLQPILPLWRAMRNLTYMAFIVIFIIIGLSIIFRVRLSPQTTVSIQSALPQMIVALLFVTFSYAIAGLLIDFSYVLFYVIVWALGAGSGGIITDDQTKAAINNYTNGSVVSVLITVASQGITAIKNIVGGLLP